MVIDIGVFEGTPELYKVFSDKLFYLVDPEPDNLKIKPKKFLQFNCVIGDCDGERVFYNYSAPGVSSCFTFSDLQGSYRSELKSESVVSCLTLDSFLKINCQQIDKIGIKVDAQGSEYEIFNTASPVDSRVKWIIVENNIVDRYNTDSHFSNVTAALLKQGFRFLNLSQQTTTYTSVAYDTIYLRSDHVIFGGKI